MDYFSIKSKNEFGLKFYSHKIITNYKTILRTSDT